MNRSNNPLNGERAAQRLRTQRRLAPPIRAGQASSHRPRFNDRFVVPASAGHYELRSSSSCPSRPLWLTTRAAGHPALGQVVNTIDHLVPLVHVGPRCGRYCSANGPRNRLVSALSKTSRCFSPVSPLFRLFFRPLSRQGCLRETLEHPWPFPAIRQANAPTKCRGRPPSFQGGGSGYFVGLVWG
jgi:hypothetical protein